jgi:uncharacterized membrane protein YfcA
MTFFGFSMDVVYLFLLLGAISGLLSGLIGIGGGFILNPGFYFVFTEHLNMPSENAMLYALGTTMGCMFIASSLATQRHGKREMVRWDFFNQLFIGMVIGVVIGVFIATRIDTHLVKLAFAFYSFYVGFMMLLSYKVDPVDGQTPTAGKQRLKSVAMGIFCGLLGTGGATIVVRHLKSYNLPMRQAMATASALQIPVAFFALVSFILMGNSFHQAAKSPVWLGNFSFTTFLISITTIFIFTPIGVYASHKMPVPTIKRIFGVVAIFIGLYMAGFLKLFN